MQNYNLKLKIFNFLLVFLTFGFWFLTFVPLVKAQQVSLAISPPLVELFIKPGKSVLIAYKLQNLGDPAVFSSFVLPFSPLDDQGNTKIKEQFEGPIRFNLENADIVLNDPYFLKTKTSQQLLLKIRVPEGTPEGDYYYTFLSQTQPAKGTEGNVSSTAKATIGANILITVTESGKVAIKGKMSLFDVLPRYRIKIFGRTFNLFESGHQIPVILILKNQGKNLIKPQGEITLLGNFGERAKFAILPQNILAESQRIIQATPSSEINCPETRKSPACRQPVSLVLSGFFVGKYRLSASLNFGEGTVNVFAYTTFYAIPLKLILGIIIAIIIATIVIKRVRE